MVQFVNLSDDGQPQPGAAVLLGTGFFYPIELTENFVKLRDARAGIMQGNDDVFCILP